MPEVLDKPETDVDVLSDVDAKEELLVREPELIPPRIVMPPEPARFMRWLGWLAVLVMVVGAGFLVWNTVTEDVVVVDATAGISSEQMDIIRQATTGYGAATLALDAQGQAYLAAERSYADFTSQEWQTRAYLTAERSFADAELDLRATTSGSLTHGELLLRSEGIRYGEVTATEAVPSVFTHAQMLERAEAVHFGAVGANPSALTQQEMLLRATTGYDFAQESWSLQTLELLRSMPPTP